MSGVPTHEPSTNAPLLEPESAQYQGEDEVGGGGLGEGGGGGRGKGGGGEDSYADE